MYDFSRFECLTFDCYGTLIDWETGILSALKPLLAAHNRDLDDERLLQLYGTLEAQAEAGEYRPYREILRFVTQRIGSRLSFALHDNEIDTLPISLPRWPAFSDTVESLRRLKSRYKLAIISNTDDDLFAETAKILEVPLDFVITAQQARSYKPSHRNFELAVEKMAVPREKILHCAQSIFHDIVPAKQLGISNVWVNRRAGRAGSGATRAAQETPDLAVTSLKELADLATS